jgi:hypothetical protein
MRLNGLQHGQTAEVTGDSWRGTHRSPSGSTAERRSMTAETFLMIVATHESRVGSKRKNTGWICQIE